MFCDVKCFYASWREVKRDQSVIKEQHHLLTKVRDDTKMIDEVSL